MLAKEHSRIQNIDRLIRYEVIKDKPTNFYQLKGQRKKLSQNELTEEKSQKLS